MKRFISFVGQNGPVLIVCAAILWALDGIIRRSLYSLSPVIIVFYEHLIGTLVILPVFLPQLKSIKLSRKEWLILTGIALFSGLLGTIWFTTALQKVNFISFSVVFLIQKLQPLFAITTAVIFLREKIDKRYAVWAGLALVAAYFVTFPNGVVNLATGAGTVTAALYALGAAAAWGSTTTFSKMVLKNNSHVAITGLRFILTSVLGLIAVVLVGQTAALFTPTGSQFLRFVFIAVSTGMVALLLYYRGLKLTEVKITTLLELTFPVLAIMIDAVLYKSYLSVSQYVAAAILTYSIYRIARLQHST